MCANEPGGSHGKIAGTPCALRVRSVNKPNAKTPNIILGQPPLDDAAIMSGLVRYTMKSMDSERPTPFGSEVVDSRTGKPLVRALNAVARENDPSSHAEVRAIRLACKRLKAPRLAGFTLYTTCEPCPMCMSTALWSGLDRVVYGATIEDAAKHCWQIYIPSREVQSRSDMKCVVEGPVSRELAYTLFTHPKMLDAFQLWHHARDKE